MTAPKSATSASTATTPRACRRPARRRLHRARRQPVRSNYRSTRRSTRTSRGTASSPSAGIDTRALTRHLRDHGSQNGAIGTDSPELLVRKAREAPDMAGLDLVKRVTPKEPTPSPSRRASGAPVLAARPPSRHVVAIDFGLKQNILRCLVDAGCEVTVVPASTTRRSILALRPDGVFLSNGPGDPAAVGYAVETVEGAPRQEADLRHLPRSPAPRARARRQDVQAQVRPSRRQPAGARQATGRDRDHHAEPRLLRRPRSLEGRVETTHMHLNDGTSEGLAAPASTALSACSTTPRRPPARTTRSTCSSASTSSSTARAPDERAPVGSPVHCAPAGGRRSARYSALPKR